MSETIKLAIKLIGPTVCDVHLHTHKKHLMSCTVHEDLSKFYCCRRQYALKSLSLSEVVCM